MSKFSKSEEAVAQCADGIHFRYLSILYTIPLCHYRTSLQRRRAPSRHGIVIRGIWDYCEK